MGGTLNIYPTRLKVEAEIARLLAGPGVRTLFADSITSFGEFEGGLADDLAGIQAIDETVRWLVLHEAVTGDPAFRRLKHLEALTGTEGFVRSVGELVQQLKLGLVTESDMETITGFAPGKEEWVKSVFARYGRLMKKHGLYDAADVRLAVLDKLAASPVPPGRLARYGEVRVHESFHFTPSRFELLRLTGRFMPVLIHFPLPDERRKAFDFVERDIQKFQSLEDKAGMIDLRFEEPGEDGPLSRFCGALFGEESPGPVEGLEGCVEVACHSGRYREVEEAAGEILAMKGDRPWSDFCLVFRELEKYGAIVGDVFRRADIPLYMRRGIPLRGNPYVRTVMGIFTAVESGFERGEVMKLFGSSYFSYLPNGVTPHGADRLAARCGITAGPAALWERRLKFLKAPGEKAAARKMVALVAGLEKLAGARRAGQCAAAFKKILSLLGGAPPRFADPAAHRDSPARGAFARALEDFGRHMKRLGQGDAGFTWRDLRRIMEDALGNAAHPEWSSRDHVYALNIHELAGMRFPHVFILGLHDGEFPLRLQRGSILAEGEKREFNSRHAAAVLGETPELKRGRAVFSRLGESWEEESFLFHLAARSATRRIFLYYSEYDLGGKELAVSPFIDEVRDAFPQIPFRQSPRVALEKDYGAQLDAPAREAKLLREMFETPADGAGALEEVYRRYARKRDFALACEASRMELARNSFYGEYDPALRAAASDRFTGKTGGSAAPLLRRFGRAGGRVFSPSALERYAYCPFRFFMEYVLECEPPKTPSPDMERTVEGNVIHHALQMYYAAKKPDPAAPFLAPRAARLRLMEECAAKAFGKAEAAGEQGEQGIWELAKEQMRAGLALFVDYEEELFAEGAFAVIATEHGFGGAENPLSVDAPGGKIFLKGIADRIDWLPATRMLRVVDYKHSANISVYGKKLAPELFLTESFQPPLYLYAALKTAWPKLPRPPAGAFAAYLTVKREPKITRHIESPFDAAGDAAALEQLASAPEFTGRLEAVVNGIETGDFSVTPKDCMFCKYRAACRYREVRQVAKNE